MKMHLPVGLLLWLAACSGAPTTTEHPKPGTIDQGGNGKPAPTIDGPTLKVLDPVALGSSVKGVTALCDDNLAIARKIIDGIKKQPAEPDKLSWQSTLGRLDEAFLSINNGSEFPYLAGVA